MKSDQMVVIIDVVMLLVYSGVWAIGLFTHKLSFLLAFVNGAVGAGVIVYWIIRQLQIRQHYFEGREIGALILELMVAALGVYTVLYQPPAIPFRYAQYIIAGIHILILVALLVFMATFSMKKLW